MSQARPNQHEVDVYAGEWILNGGDQTKAWRKTFPESKAKPDVIHRKASVFHSLAEVQVRIKQFQKEQATKDKHEFDMSAAEIKTMLHDIATASMRDKHDQHGNAIPNAPSAAVSALSEINRMNGNHAPKEIDLSSTDGTMTPKITATDPLEAAKAYQDLMAGK